jgi:hypothetical protein
VKYGKEETEQAVRNLHEAIAGMHADQFDGRKTIHTCVTHVSRSGLSRRIKVYAAVHGELVNLTWSIARVTESPMDDRGVRVDGGNMDMCFHVLDHAMFKLGVKDWQSSFRKENL